MKKLSMILLVAAAFSFAPTAVFSSDFNTNSIENFGDGDDDKKCCKKKKKKACCKKKKKSCEGKSKEECGDKK